MKKLIVRIRRLLPVCVRAGFLSMLRNLKDRSEAVVFAQTKGDVKNFPCLLYSHKAHLYRNYPEPWFSLQRYKVDNLKLAAAKIDGAVLRKGEIFSFWHFVGKTSMFRGYRKGMSIINGGVTAAMGGGLCQLSNALYWTALHCGCMITERHRHSLDIFPDSKRTVPFGCGATIFYNYLDLRFMQNIFESIYLRTYLDDEFLHIEAYTAEPSQYKWILEERNHRFERIDGIVYRKNEVHRITTRAKEAFSEENEMPVSTETPFKMRPKKNRRFPRSQIIIEELVAENCGRVLYDLPENEEKRIAEKNKN